MIVYNSYNQSNQESLLVTWNKMQWDISLKKIIANMANRFISSVVEVYNKSPRQVEQLFLPLAIQAQLVQVRRNSFKVFEGFAEMKSVFESA